MKTTVLVLLSAAMVALLLLSRYFAVSRAGLPLGWMLYFGLLITAVGVIIALRLASDTEYHARRIEIISEM
jgi:hypothetical protein